MTEKNKPKALILETAKETRELADKVLTSEGWETYCEISPGEALKIISRPLKTPFVLFICNHKLPGMDGDDVLRKIREVSPLTQRMLFVPAGDPAALITAIHKAKIHACITIPFEGKDLAAHSKECFKRFVLARKREKFKQVTLQQNRQMAKIAEKLKLKDANNKKIIEKKKLEIIKLKSEKRGLKENPDTYIDLKTFLELKNAVPSPEIFKKYFLYLCRMIKELFDRTADRDKALSKVTLDLSALLAEKAEAETGQDKQGAGEEAAAIEDQIIKSVLKSALDKKDEDIENLSLTGNGDAPDNEKDQWFEISVSEDRLEAKISFTGDGDRSLPEDCLSHILELLKKQQISFGIVDDDTIQQWIENPARDDLVIARGEAPVQGRSAKIYYHFKTDYTTPGRIKEDGSIDFKERGEIPFVSKDDVLAVKSEGIEGRQGIDLSGNPIEIKEFSEPLFEAGQGAVLSENGLTISAAIDGQPNLDALGTITVNPELVIPGDVDYETGNIDFQGNIVIKGSVKEGFSVKGVNLTANEIQGAVIKLSGDLNVSAGITESKVSVHGNIQAKFINNSTVMGYGNLVVSREIIDSNIMISGVCQNESGHILNCFLAAKLGIDAGNIGTSTAKPSRLEIGIDRHILTITKEIDEKLEKSVALTNELKEQTDTLEKEDKKLYQLVTEKAQVQDRAQLEIKELTGKEGLENSSRIRALENKAKQAEQELNHIFEKQDQIASEIEAVKDRIRLSEEKNKKLVQKKRALKEFSAKEHPRVVLTVARKICQDESIKSPNASLFIKEDASRCKIMELATELNGMMTYELVITDP